MSTDILEARPLTLKDLESVPGVLGNISRERLGDYKDVPLSLELDNPPIRPSFLEALQSDSISLIAEVKRSSPSKGAIANLDPVEAAQAYECGGASALSILTESRHFGGELTHVEAVATKVNLPILRKDFTVHPAQLYEAKRAGASAVLLIVAVLKDLTAAYLQLTAELELDALVEVHDEAELEIALTSGAKIIGVNNRDLRTLEIDLNNAPRLIRQAKDAGFTGVLVAESGYSQAEQLQSLKGVADAVLIGSSIAGSGDLEGAVRELLQSL